MARGPNGKCKALLGRAAPDPAAVDYPPRLGMSLHACVPGGNVTLQLEDRVAIVTGAGRGIGRGIATVLAGRGARVVVSDLDAEAARWAAAEIGEHGGDAIDVQADVTSSESLRALVDAALAEYGQIDICVANAGVIGADGFETRNDFTTADWDLTFDVNVKGTVYTAEAVVPHMKERRKGKIVNIASQGGRPPRGPKLALGRQIVPYLVSKAAIIQWTHLLAQDLGQHNINVNCVCPGTLWTPMWERIAQNRITNDPASAGRAPREVFQDSLRARQLLPVEQTPEDVGLAVAFLASDDAAEITGQALNVNGGAVMN